MGPHTLQGATEGAEEPHLQPPLHSPLAQWGQPQPHTRALPLLLDPKYPHLTLRCGGSHKHQHGGQVMLDSH